MVVKCFLKNCTKQYNKHIDVSYHRFPMKDVACYQRWVQSIPENLLDLPLPEYSYICSLHFCHTSYQPPMLTSKNILRKDAYPTIFYTEEDNEDDTIDNAVKISCKNNGFLFTISNINVRSFESKCCTLVMKQNIRCSKKNPLFFHEICCKINGFLFITPSIFLDLNTVSLAQKNRLKTKNMAVNMNIQVPIKDIKKSEEERLIQEEHILPKYLHLQDQTTQTMNVSKPHVIHDDYEIIFVRDEIQPVKKSGGFNWSHEAVFALLNAYKQQHLITSKRKTKEFWTVICSQLVKKGYDLTAFQCKKKMASLKNTYESVKSHSAQSSNNNQTWQYFDIMDELFKKKSLVVPVVTLDSSNPNLLFSEHVDSDKRSLDPCNTEPPFKRLKQIGESNWKNTVEKIIAIMEERTIERKKIHKEAMARQDKLLEILEKILNKFNRSNPSLCGTEFTSKRLKQSEEDNMRNTLQKITFVVKRNSSECAKMYEEMIARQAKLFHILGKICDE